MENSKIVVWGIGAEAEKLIKEVGVDQVLYFVDNNEQVCTPRKRPCSYFNYKI